MLGEVLVGALLVICTVAIHAVGATLWLNVLLIAGPRFKDRVKYGSSVLLSGATALFLLALHVCEVVLWAEVYCILPDLEGPRTFPEALYFSFATFTTVGYGDVTIQGKWRLLSGIEAMNGILLFGWSTAMLYALIRHHWQIGYSSREEKGR